MRLASFLSACALAALLLVPGVAAAQIVHSGVDAARLTPAGLVLVDGTLPAAAAPIRLLYAPASQARPELVISVHVGTNAADARAALASFRRGIEHALPDGREAGELSVRVDADQLAFVRDNVFVAVRRIDGTHDVTAIARDVDGVVRASPVGAPQAAPFAVRVGTPVAQRGGRERIVPLVVSGDSLVVSADRGLVLVDVASRTGSDAPYHTSRGWFVRVQGDRMPAAADFTVAGVDSQLRVSSR